MLMAQYETFDVCVSVLVKQYDKYISLIRLEFQTLEVVLFAPVSRSLIETYSSDCFAVCAIYRNLLHIAAVYEQFHITSLRHNTWNKRCAFQSHRTDCVWPQCAVKSHDVELSSHPGSEVLKAIRIWLRRTCHQMASKACWWSVTNRALVRGSWIHQ